MYSQQARLTALHQMNDGVSLARLSRDTGISRSTLREWRDAQRVGSPHCPACDGRDLDRQAYAGLFGFYLGDGSLSRAARCYVLRISCDATYSAIIDDVENLTSAVHPERKTYRVRGPGVIVVQSLWMHWPCMFPQHGSGRKHERVLGMQPWQWAIIEEHPADFLRGLFHSDGCRAKNWATQIVSGRKKRYDYPRWHFTNESAEIMGWCRDALDLVGVDWRQSSRRMLSVSRREAVARLDELIGLKW